MEDFFIGVEVYLVVFRDVLFERIGRIVVLLEILVWFFGLILVCLLGLLV